VIGFECRKCRERGALGKVSFVTTTAGARRARASPRWLAGLPRAINVARGMMTDQTGARFFDEHRRDRGWASKVIRRVRAVDGLMTMDVTTTEPGLAAFLNSLDRAPLRVQSTDLDGESCTFVWASGYANGQTIRVQGALERPQRPWPV
jgi:hypothetical protein